jgi:hypothetical protein
LRGKPELVSTIEEAHESPALGLLLSHLAQPGSPIISLGCDLGQHLETKCRPKWRHVAGGYVQIAAARLGELGVPELLTLAGGIESVLHADVADDRWDVQFDLRAVHFKFDDLVEAYSIWIWFFAAASPTEQASNARERLLTSLARSARSPEALESAPSG